MSDPAVTATMRPYGGVVIAPAFVDARHADGRRSTQCRASVLAPSKAAAVRSLVAAGLTSITRTEFDRRWSADANPATVEALSRVDPGSVLFAPLDPGGTVRGEAGWVHIPRPR